ncbi:MAG: hypothetical protein AAF805_05985 [Planctomycetota bacterium]
MKKTALLLAVAVTATSLTGCGCFRRMRDALCRGAYCGAPTVAAPAPVAPVMPLAACPPAMGYDPTCGYAGAQMVGYGSTPMYDSGWVPGGCDDCGAGSYSLPSYPVDSSAGGTTYPGPATLPAE